MKKFIKKIIVLLAIFFLITEVATRFFVDPLFFWTVDTYNEKNNESISQAYNAKPTESVDYLFIGTSRIPASINPLLMKELTNGVVINAGRGGISEGIHIQAIENKLKQYPNYLKGAIVLVEYAGTRKFTASFKEKRMMVLEPPLKSIKPMPHLMVPHLDNSSIIDYWRYSHNQSRIKSELTSLYFSSTYRSSLFVNEKFHRLNQPFISTSKVVSEEGGIRNDKIEFALQKAIDVAKINKSLVENSPSLTLQRMDESTLSKLYELVSKNGGTMVLFEMPLHSVQKSVFSSEKARLDKQIMEAWLSEKNIPIVYNSDFYYSDEDFPDTWHLSITRRDEFTEKLFNILMDSDYIK